MPQTGPWTGDPVWLLDVLRAEGVNPVEYPGWRERGHGDFKDIRGVMVHHTGSDTASAASTLVATGKAIKETTKQLAANELLVPLELDQVRPDVAPDLAEVHPRVQPSRSTVVLADEASGIVEAHQ